MASLELVPELIKSQLESIAKSDANLLIVGESGTGKDQLAQLIHENSLRYEKCAVTINLSSIPEDLVERELFGSVAGAFTDSKVDYNGKFLEGMDSTIIIDEISEVSMQTQAKLLKVIDSKIITPIGSSESIKVNCRIIALSKVNLFDLVTKGQFREDLYYRLNVLNLFIPPLRERLTEIKIIINFFINILSQNKVTVKEDALLELYNYSWPGNIRELKNCLERAITLSPTNEITCEYLLLSSNNTCNITGVTLKDAVNRFKKDYILKVLESNDWNITKSAQVLDIQRTYLSRLVKELYNK